MRIACAPIATRPLDIIGNTDRCIAAVHEARRQHAHLVVLPELAITGYGCEDAFAYPSLWAQVHGALHRIAEACSIALPGCAHEPMTVIVGAPLHHAGALFNGAYVIGVAPCIGGGGWDPNNGQHDILGVIAKRHLADDGIHYERRWFQPWPDGVADTCVINDVEVPIGDIGIMCHLLHGQRVRIGIEICEDAWVADRPGLAWARRGCSLIVNPSASHAAIGKTVTRRRLVEDASRSMGCGYIYTNLIGNEAGRVVYDGQCLAAIAGNTMMDTGLFTGDEPDLARDAVIATRIHIVDMPIMLATVAQATSASRTPLLDNATWVESLCWLESTPNPVVQPDRTSMCVTYAAPHAHYDLGHTQVTDDLRMRDLQAILVRGLRDYVAASGTSGCTLSLSGGCDSAMVAVIAHLALKPLGHPLYTVYQRAGGSTKTTAKLAEDLARSINARHAEWSVRDQVSAYTQMASTALLRSLSWTQDDLTLQNIQARARAPGIWMIANATNTLLLTTSNRTEAALGYATMDGDTAGCLALIAGLTKVDVRAWLAWFANQGDSDMHAAVRAVATTPSSPELRPSDGNTQAQTSEGDLAPFQVLATIEHRFVRERLIGPALSCAVHAAHPSYSMGTVATWCDRFLTLWHRNQWKRERYAPGIHVDDVNLDPRSWCRFPILSGGALRQPTHDETLFVIG